MQLSHLLPPFLRFRRTIGPIRWFIGIVILTPLLILLFLLQDKKIRYFEVQSESMSPTLQVGDRLVIIADAKYERGSIVVFEAPHLADTTLVVKRLVAMEKDSVILRDGRLYINGTQNLPPQGESKPSVDLDDQEWMIQPGQGFVAGDNRLMSEDSRSYGPIDLRRIKGTIFYRTEPRARRGRIE